MKEKDLRRFLSLAIVRYSCWYWRGGHSRKGYAKFWWRGKTRLALRVVCAWVWGLSSRQDVHHLCEHVWCVNPWHLQPISRREHLRMSDSPVGVNARKTHCIHGHPFVGENLHVLANGERRCRACHRLRMWRYYHR